MTIDIPDKFKVLRQISKGNYGVVYLCENTYLSNRKEAVKLIYPKSKKEEELANELNKNLFESSVLEYLRKSQYIVEIYDADFLTDCFRINMEYLQNGSVQDQLDSQTILTTKQVLKISECILHALEYAHNKHIFHLDVKPGNILVKNENVFKLSDFGLSSITDKDGKSLFKEIYTKHFPPEKLSQQQNKATVQTDIYMFGVTLYRLLNGDAYINDQWGSYQSQDLLINGIVKGKFPNRKKYLPHVPNKLKRIVNKCLNIDLNKRFQNVREIRNAFGKVKIKYNWKLKTSNSNACLWECRLNDKTMFELNTTFNSQNYEISLLKYGKTRKTRVVKYCKKSLSKSEFEKIMNDIFNEYF
ncbi:MAG: serine/threonine protein kinase [Ignavibacteriae bacterium]|nr:serine/threonine protein kinase [Ignavibacteriota bacterium]MCB1584330.1 serine/threonine protein kinase [Xanthomonadales bacterium]